MLYLPTFGGKIWQENLAQIWRCGERRQGEEGTPGRTILPKMCMHAPDEGANRDMEGRCGVSL